MEMLKAIRANDVRKIQKKLQKGFDVNKPIQEVNKNKDVVLTIPLSLAAARGFRDIVEVLLSYGANIHACNLDWSSPLHMATFHGHIQVIRFLLQRNVNLNNSDQHGNTVLHLAATRNNFEATVLFLEYKIDAEIRNNKGQTALEVAKLLNHEHVVEAIADKKQVTSLQAATEDLKRAKAKQVMTEINQKERLQRQLQKIEVQELNVSLKTKEQELTYVENELETLNTEACNIKTQITLLEGKLKEVNMKRLNKECAKNKALQEVEKMKERRSSHFEDKENRRDTMKEVGKESEYECPICFELPLPPRKVYQCNNGHVYCSECKEKPGMSLCPQCRVPLSQKTAIRNIVYEELLAKRNHQFKIKRTKSSAS